MNEDPSRDRFHFQDFCLIPGERVLLRNGLQVALGGRALDILILLTSRSRELVGKQELIDTVWPDVSVEEVGLRVHIAALRKALGGDQAKSSTFIANVSGRRYCFVAPVSKQAAARQLNDHAMYNGPQGSRPARGERHADAPRYGYVREFPGFRKRTCTEKGQCIDGP